MLTETQYKLIIRKLQHSCKTLKEIGKVAGCDASAVHNINQGKVAAVKMIYDGEFPIRKSAAHNRDKIIMQMFEDGEIVEEIAAHFELESANVRKILRKYGYKVRKPRD